jgi:hypothetical protein
LNLVAIGCNYCHGCFGCNNLYLRCNC